MEKSADELNASRERRPFQFGVAALLVLMTLVGLLVGGLAGMLQRAKGSTMTLGLSGLLVVVAPMGAMLVMSWLRRLNQR